MIYISKRKPVVNVPKHIFNTEGNYKLVISSPVTNDVIIVEDSGDISTHRLYYKFDLDSEQINSLSDGEFTYRLYDKYENIIETGLLAIGDYYVEDDDVVNNTFNIESKIQYNG